MARKKATTAIRNRIIAHVTLKARELVPHELNFRTHPDEQKTALRALYREVGFARSLLGYRTPEGRIKLIDGHLRAALDPEQEVTVEVLDVDETEARKLLLSMDPLATLAGTNPEPLAELRATTTTESLALANLWDQIEESQKSVKTTLDETDREDKPLIEQCLVIITCRDENHQRDVLRWCKEHNLDSKAVLS